MSVRHPGLRGAGRWRIWRWWIAVAVGISLLLVTRIGSVGGGGGAASATSTLAGSQGTNSALPLTSSAVTVSGTGQFANLQVTVNQTQNLVNQALSVTWTGGPPTIGDPPTMQFTGAYDGNYLQVFECWSTDPQTTPTPEQCEFGGESTTVSSYPVSGITPAFERVISQSGWTCGANAPPTCLSYTQYQQLAASDPSRAYFDPTTYIIDPFQAVDGTVVPATVNYNYEVGGLPYKSFDTNPYFNFTTSNELDFARTYPDGTGQALFSVDTGLEAPGLGCGQEVLDNATVTPQCWLVIVPRGTPDEENPPELQGSTLVLTSPLSATAWANHISVPLGFDPIGSSCSLGSTVRRVVGGELAAAAVANWQPALCAVPGAPPYSYSALSEDTARSLISGAGTGGTAGLAVVSKPIDPTTVDPSNPLVYAPLTLSGVVIGLNIQRVPALDEPSGDPNPDEAPLRGLRVTQLNLTPRLVAKLLTESYKGQFFPGASPPTSYSWAAKNPIGLVNDPDFLQFNPEFAELANSQSVDGSGFVVEESASDATSAVWQWILADPEAKAWLGGQADPWGMQVNPYYSTDASENPAGSAFGTPAPNTFPKSDPYCYQEPIQGGNEINGQPYRPLCFQDWTPYVNSLHDAAAATRSANSGAKTTPSLSATNSNDVWTSNGPQRIGDDLVMSVTDTANAARFGLQTASLSQAGDDGSGRQFVAPDSNGLLTGEQAMTQSAVSGVLEPNPASTAAGAYPLTVLTYAVAAPLGLDQAAREDYSTFINYGVGAGQSPGLAFGSLPAGYVSLPSALVQQATTAAGLILNPTSLEPTTTTTAAPTTTTAPATTTATASAVTVAPSATATTTPVTAAAVPPPVTSPPAVLPVDQGAAVNVPAPAAPAVPTTTCRGPAASALAPAVSISPPILATSRTPRTPVGPARFALVLVLVVGLLAGAGAGGPGLIKRVWASSGRPSGPRG